MPTSRLLCPSCGKDGRPIDGPCVTCGRGQDPKDWWFAVSSKNPEEITVYLDGALVPKEDYVVAEVAAGTTGRVKIKFSDGSTRELSVKWFDAGQGDFKHRLKAGMDSAAFAEQFKKDRKSLKSTGGWKKAFCMVGVGVATVAGVSFAIVNVPAFLTAVTCMHTTIGTAVLPAMSSEPHNKGSIK